MDKTDKCVLQYEVCVSCGLLTAVLVETPIDCRKNYVCGCGQLCEKCAGQIDREQHKRGSSETSLEEVNRIMTALKSTDEGD